MAKSELGTKRICPTTGKKFYDLNKTPVISPYTGEVVPIAPVAPARATRGGAEPRHTPAAADTTPEPADDDDDSTFIADDEEGDEDVTDIIGDVGGDEET